MRFYAAIILFLVLLSLSSCSTIGRVEEIIGSKEGVEIVNSHSGTVSISVSGGDDSFVSSEIFQEALIKTINNFELFDRATAEHSENYKLTVVILSMYHGGLAFTHYTTTLWSLADSKGVEIWSSKFESEGKSSNFGGAARSKISAEDSARKAIELGVTMLSALELPS